MKPRRLDKFKKVVAQRQPNLTVIMENVWDSHNVGAVLRSCDSVGIKEIFVLNTEKKLIDQQKLIVGKRTSMGTSKWVDVHFYTDIDACFQHVRSGYEKVLGTHLNEEAKNLYELDLAASVALVFGNEMLGITEAVIERCDGNFHIPQMGMAESLNVSVACAVTLYEAYRQRQQKGYYDQAKLMSDEAQEALLDEYVARHKAKIKPKRTYLVKNQAEVDSTNS